MEIPKAIDQMFSYFAVVHPPRRQPPTTLHSLEAMLTLTLLATMCGAQNGVESAPWGQAAPPGARRVFSPASWHPVARDVRPGVCLTGTSQAPAGFDGVDERSGTAR